jgi:hypothetical protein
MKIPLLVSFILNLSKADETKELQLLDLKVPTSMYKGNGFVQLAVKNRGRSLYSVLLIPIILKTGQIPEIPLITMKII